MIGLLELSHHPVSKRKYPVDLVAVDLLKQFGERPQVFLPLLEHSIQLISFLMEGAPGLGLRCILQQPLKRLLNVHIDLDIRKGLLCPVMRTPHSRPIFLLRGG